MSKKERVEVLERAAVGEAFLPRPTETSKTKSDIRVFVALTEDGQEEFNAAGISFKFLLHYVEEAAKRGEVSGDLMKDGKISVAVGKELVQSAREAWKVFKSGQPVSWGDARRSLDNVSASIDFLEFHNWGLKLDRRGLGQAKKVMEDLVLDVGSEKADFSQVVHLARQALLAVEKEANDFIADKLDKMCESIESREKVKSRIQEALTFTDTRDTRKRLVAIYEDLRKLGVGDPYYAGKSDSFKMGDRFDPKDWKGKTGNGKKRQSR